MNSGCEQGHTLAISLQVLDHLLLRELEALEVALQSL